MASPTVCRHLNPIAILCSPQWPFLVYDQQVDQQLCAVPTRDAGYDGIEVMDLRLSHQQLSLRALITVQMNGGQL